MLQGAHRSRIGFGPRVVLATICIVPALCLASSSDVTSPPGTERPGKATVTQTYSMLPLSFEQNQGQADKQVKFLSRGSGYGLYMTAQDVVLTLHKPAAATDRFTKMRPRRLSPNGAGPNDQSTSVYVEPGGKATAASTTDVIRMQLEGSSTKAMPVGVDQLPGTANYFLGSDPARWRTNVPTYSKVSYAGVYPGVDLIYYGNHRQLEYDFVVAPGASPKPIRLHFTGAQSLQIDKDGNLGIIAPDGSIQFRKPEVYQWIAGNKHPVAGKFKLLAHNSAGFDLGRYDRTKPIVIDPILAYSTFFGGTNAEFVTAVATDSAGSAYVTGLTISEDFPLTAGAFQAVNFATPSNDVSTAFISKFNPSGTALLYSTYIGGVAISNTLHQQGDYGKSIAVDASGNAYITGYTYSTDFPITSGAFQKGNLAAIVHLATGFVTKLNSSGTGLIYSTFLGGNVLDELTSIAIDPAGDAFISGITFSSDYPTTPGVLQPINNAFSTNGFNQVVTKMNPTGSALIYSTYLGGASSDGSTIGGVYWTNPIVVDKSGNAYVAGFTTSGDFPVTPGAYQPQNHGGFNVTVSKLNVSGTKLLYSTYLGGSANSICEGLAVDSAGSAYVAGYTSGGDFPVTKGAFQTVNRADTNTTTSADSNQNGFVTKLNPTGTALVYSTYLGGTTGPWGGDQIYELALDAAGDAFVAGSAMSADFPVTENAYQANNRGATHCCDYTAYTSNGFLAEFNSTGTGLIYSTYFGGSGTQNPEGPGASGDTAYGLALGKNGNVFVTGFTTSPNFPVTQGAFETKYHTQEATGFVAHFILGAAPTTKNTGTTLTPSASSVTPGTPLTFTAAVSPLSGSAIPKGNMVFSIDEKPVKTVALDSAGEATYSTSSLPAGAHYVLASYSGNATYSPSAEGFNEIIMPIKPVISPAGGIYTSQQTVTITESTKAAVLYYAIDGLSPSMFSIPYTKPITIDLSRTVNAVAVANSDANSAVATAAYTIIGSPSVLAAPATAISASGATLNAFVNPLGLAGSYVFQYGTSSSALTSSTAKTALSGSKTRVELQAQIASLKSKTKYFYRIAVTTAGGSTSGAILSFTTN